MRNINTHALKKRGFVISEHNPLVTYLKVMERTYLCLIKKNTNWVLGHSENGRTIYLQPEEYNGYKTIETMEEIESEIQWLKIQGIHTAIDYSLSLIYSKGFDINDFLIHTKDQASSC